MKYPLGHFNAADGVGLWYDQQVSVLAPWCCTALCLYVADGNRVEQNRTE